jgi:hypothetical protein
LRFHAKALRKEGHKAQRKNTHHLCAFCFSFLSAFA